MVNIVNNVTRDDETKCTTCGHPLCFELVHSRTQTRTIYYIYFHINCNFKRFSNRQLSFISDFRVSPRKLRALLNTQTNLMEATITLDHGKHLTKPKTNKRTRPSPMGLMSIHSYIWHRIYVSGYESDWIPFKYATE